MVKYKKQNKRQSNRSRHSVAPTIQLTDTSISFHILWLDSFQESNSESLRTLTNPKDCEVPLKKQKKTTWVLSKKHSTSLAGWETYRGRESLWAVRSLSFFVFFCASSRLLPFFSWENSHTLESKHFTSYRCSGPEWPDLPRHRRSEVIHYNPRRWETPSWCTVVGWLDWLVSTFKSKLSATSQDCCL